MKTKENKWTVEEEQQLIDLRFEGKTYLEISEITGRTPDSLRKRHFLLMKEWNTPEFWKKVDYLIGIGVLEEDKKEK